MCIRDSGCARCHDHKYDPITQREFYQLFAFFNNVPESGLIKADNPPPVLSVPSQEQEKELKRLSSAAVSYTHLDVYKRQILIPPPSAFTHHFSKPGTKIVPLLPNHPAPSAGEGSS